MFAANLKNKTLDCFPICLHFKNRHCIVHKHLKQEIFKIQKTTFEFVVTMATALFASQQNIYHMNPSKIVGKAMKIQLLTAMRSKVI